MIISAIILLIKYDLIFSVLKYFRNRPINIAELKDNIKCQRFCGAENPLNNRSINGTKLNRINARVKIANKR